MACAPPIATTSIPSASRSRPRRRARAWIAARSLVPSTSRTALAGWPSNAATPLPSPRVMWRLCPPPEEPPIVRRPGVCSVRPGETSNGGQQVLALLPRDLGVARRERVGDAVPDVVLEQLDRDALQSGRDGGDLREDVDAGALVLDHPLDAANLPLDPVQALDQCLLVGDVSVGHAGSPSSR